MWIEITKKCWMIIFRVYPIDQIVSFLHYKPKLKFLNIEERKGRRSTFFIGYVLRPFSSMYEITRPG
jgi:hypothetical protein